ncbi:MAG: sigma-E processing peptidase SpoIIGA [Clostridiales bacterium]|nr:sigma-E processing peptidase SpoIIGA [Clostridiales bacterium]
MDFLSLYITGKLLHSEICPLRLALASLLGAVFATLMAVFDNDNFIIKLIWWLAFVSCAATMCAISYKGSLIKELSAFIAVNLGLGGLMSALYGAIQRSGFKVPTDEADDISSPLMFIVFAAISGIVSLVYGRIRSTRGNCREVDVKAAMSGNEIKLRLLVDSGNLLCEPVSGRPVIVSSREKVKGFIADELLDISVSDINKLEPELMRRVRLIPARGIGAGGLLVGIMPDSVTVYDGKTANGRAVEAVIALADNRDFATCDFAGCDGIIPEILIL